MDALCGWIERTGIAQFMLVNNINVSMRICDPVIKVLLQIALNGGHLAPADVTVITQGLFPPNCRPSRPLHGVPGILNDEDTGESDDIDNNQEDPDPPTTCHQTSDVVTVISNLEAAFQYRRCCCKKNKEPGTPPCRTVVSLSQDLRPPHLITRLNSLALLEAVYQICGTTVVSSERSVP
ncbi:uncharacterized protein CC84DRAFT_1180413 [Paraphaeosphaeria sporulosa]|uniref:Uncharacterized protein n=1 Tax=Paraphaeosphaeria sporulosa TaxID=1460663 RepID=A0A177BYP4_9PLEO|nr:uncharacterized protein CC84DRAFT_1180413 [Paraphaeosphaeria sporulosa]OAG00395.1 hypothetical protein CC84DRAFT_1180413 [Paraphaeosphaeria sporulosa]